jgi:hypothetical protein
MNKLLAFSLSLFLLCSCSSPANADKELESKLAKAYEDLYLSMYGLEFPPNEKVLETCKKNNIESCLRVYKKVQAAKKVIQDAIADDDTLALNSTLNKIVTKCADEKSGDDFTCVGAVVSLYFFDSEKYQRHIMDALSNSGSNSIKLVFSHQYPWFFNRPNPDKWIAFVNSLSDQMLPPTDKKITIEYFDKSKKSFEKFGVML